MGITYNSINQSTLHCLFWVVIQLNGFSWVEEPWMENLDVFQELGGYINCVGCSVLFCIEVNPIAAIKSGWRTSIKYLYIYCQYPPGVISGGLPPAVFPPHIISTNKNSGLNKPLILSPE